MDNLEVLLKVAQILMPIAFGIGVYIMNGLRADIKDLTKEHTACRITLAKEYRTHEDAEKSWCRQEGINKNLFERVGKLEVKTAD